MRTVHLAAFLAAIERHPGSLVGRNSDGRHVLALGRLVEDHRTKSVYGMVLRWSPVGTTEMIAPGVWFVNLGALAEELRALQTPAAPAAFAAALARL